MTMNEWDIEEAVARFRGHATLGPASRFLSAFKDEVNAHSDGWAYWRLPAHAADKLQRLIYASLRSGMGAYPHVDPPTAAEVRATLTPIKAFMTRRGTAAGMTLPVLDLGGAQ